MTIADSDVLIDALRGREPAASRVAQELRTGALATTTINVFELLSGAKTDGSQVQTKRLLSATTVLGFDEGASREAATVRRTLEAEGSPIGTADYLIAGVCLARSAALLSRNRKHFERVPGLRLETITPAPEDSGPV